MPHPAQIVQNSTLRRSPVDLHSNTMTSYTPGTLHEFDMVLSLTEASINAQFMALYKTPISNSNHDNKATPGNSKYLIAHRFAVTKPESQVGIDGYIECPRVDMNLGDSNKMKRTIRVVLSFLKNEPGTKANPVKGTPAYDPKYDSFFEYWDSDKDDKKLVKQRLNGWRFTFEAGLGKADIQQIEESHARYFHPTTFEKLKKGIDNKLFTPSSVFCLFEAGQIAQSFQLYDEQNQLITGNTKKPAPDGKLADFGQKTDDFMLAIASRFANSEHLPTPQNPFVLGYGISQPNPDPHPSEPWFIPQNFQFSVTHAPNGFGSLNFLMLLNPMQPVQNVEHNLLAGLFDVSFLDRIGASAPNPTTKRPEYNGVMAIAAKTFKEQYILKCLLPLFKLPDPSFPLRTITRDKEVIENPSVNTCTHTLNWTSSTSLDGRSWYSGTNTTTIAVTSNYVGQPMSTDALRRLVIDVSGSFDVTYKETIFSFLNSSFSSSLTVPFKLRLLATTTGKGSWDIKRDDDTKYTSIPLMEPDPKNPGMKRLVISEINSGQPGIQPNVEHTGLAVFQGYLNLHATHEYLGGFTSAAATNILDLYGKQVSGSLEMLTTQVVMPAGNVVFFNGLSTDTDHHLYSLIKYQTQSGGEQFEGTG
ncbi:hypothetical protein FRC08_018965 [Ceratobasidium sp. 394]|nr:hypothetical protein FRC08_018965 [Ceratobasidium sp. 394]